MAGLKKCRKMCRAQAWETSGRGETEAPESGRKRRQDRVQVASGNRMFHHLELSNRRKEGEEKKKDVSRSKRGGKRGTPK